MRQTTKRRSMLTVQDAFARHLIEQEIINHEQLIKALQIQSEVNRKIGEVAIDEGVMKNEEVSKVLEKQQSIKQNFGELAVKMDIISKKQLEFLLNQQQQHYVSVLEIFLYENMITMEECSQELLYFKSRHPDYKIPLNTELNEKLLLHKQLKGSIVGDIKALGLVPIFQMLAMYEKTGILKIYKGKDKVGRIALQEGKITYAEYLDQYGRPAFFDVLSLPEGKFEFYDGNSLKQKIMCDEVEFLLLEYAKDLDEYTK